MPSQRTAPAAYVAQMPASLTGPCSIQTRASTRRTPSTKTIDSGIACVPGSTGAHSSGGRSTPSATSAADWSMASVSTLAP